MKASEEQQTIIDNIKNNKNVIVDAVAGSGKSTTIMFLAQQLPERKILQVTYNSALRLEVKHKLEELSIENVKVHTFHSLAVRYYIPTAYTDTELRNILRNNVVNKESIYPFDIIVLDEVQDMTKLYFMFIQKFIKDMLTRNDRNNDEHERNNKTNHTIQLLVLGDYMQGLYEFKGSDIRYLTFADKLWQNFPNLKTRDFTHCSLKMSYRITNPMANFVNRVMLGEKRLLACKEGIPVVYIRNSRYELHMIILSTIKRLLGEGNKPEDIFFLGPSMKTSIRKLENTLVESKIPCYVPMFDKDKIDDRVINGKIVFSTFHSVKGRQRKFVFVTGFDNKYFEFFGKDLDKKKCPNTLYVACTRATERLYLIETDGFADDRPLDFLKMNHLQMKKQNYIEFKGSPQMVQNVMELGKPIHKQNQDVNKNIKVHYITPTELIKFMPDSVLDKLIPSLETIFEKVSTHHYELDIPVVIQTKKGFYEDVSDLNGIALPCIYTDRLLNQNILLNIIENAFNEMKPGEYTFLREQFKYFKDALRLTVEDSLNPVVSSVADYLYLSNIFSAIQEKLYFKISQIDKDEYTWLNDDIIEFCMGRLDKVIMGADADDDDECLREKERLEVEVNIIHPMMENENEAINCILKQYFPLEKFLFTARVDMISETNVWELKCTSSITVEHFLQTMIYAWIYRAMYPDDLREFKIFNIKTGEIYLLKNSSLETLTPLMVLLLKSKYHKMEKITDDDFLAQLKEPM